METEVIDRLVNWQEPSVECDGEISVEDYQAMVDKAEHSGYISYEMHRRKINKWFDEISKKRTSENA